MILLKMESFHGILWSSVEFHTMFMWFSWIYLDVLAAPHPWGSRPGANGHMVPHSEKIILHDKATQVAVLKTPLVMISGPTGKGITDM